MSKQVTVEIRAEGWGGYTGPLGGYLFKNGSSDGPIPLRAALRIGASIEAYDQDGRRLHPTTYPLNENPSSIEAPIVRFKTDAELQQTEPYVPETTDAGATEAIDLEPTKTVVNGRVVEKYSRAQLEAIADQKGIDGLRQIADKHGLKGRAVSELIDKILGVQ
jgi:hypothetical protein